MFIRHKQMTTALKLPVTDEDCVELQEDRVSNGSTLKPAAGKPTRKKMKATKSHVGGVRRLSIISEQEAAGKPDSHDARLGGDWAGFKNSSSFSSDDSYQPNAGDDCAALLLACLHCRFHELVGLLPDTCERAVSRVFPSYEYIKASCERDQQGKDCCNYKLEMDYNCCGSCQDAGELIELAMEISEVCYR